MINPIIFDKIEKKGFLMKDKTEWIWQDTSYPHFSYELSKIENLLQQVARKQGELLALGKILGAKKLQDNRLQTLLNEIISSSAIEGEILDRESVKSSLKEKLGLEDVQHFSQASKESRYVEILLDANTLHHDRLSIEKICTWHYKLFEKDPNLWNIQIGAFRKKGTMQVVSGVIGKEKVFYEAPQSDAIQEEMKRYLTWFNKTPSSLLKASIAHLWFVIIHPFDDGNGRLARAITEMVLSSIQAPNTPKLYSMSKSIHTHKKAYYQALEQTTGYHQKENLMDITIWHVWFLKTLEQALDESIKSIEHVVKKARFWDIHKESGINDRQTKVLNTFLDKDADGALTNKKYMKIANTTSATASRDIRSLVSRGVIKQVAGSAGRNIRYELVIP